jgi:hypothetical protein
VGTFLLFDRLPTAFHVSSSSGSEGIGIGIDIGIVIDGLDVIGLDVVGLDAVGLDVSFGRRSIFPNILCIPGNIMIRLTIGYQYNQNFNFLASTLASTLESVK